MTDAAAAVAIGVEPIDGDDGAVLVAALDLEIGERYAGDAEDAEGLDDADLAMLVVRPESVLAPLGAFLVARLEGGAVGCVALRPAPTGERGTAELKRMYVAPAARGRGVSRLLLRALEDRAVQLGYGRVVLETGVRQPEAMALYESAGYAPIRPYGAYRRSPLTRCYAKDLAPAADQEWRACFDR